MTLRRLYRALGISARMGSCVLRKTEDGKYQFTLVAGNGYPIGFQIGKVTRFGKQPVRWAINPHYNLESDNDLVKWKLVFTFTLLVPTA